MLVKQPSGACTALGSIAVGIYGSNGFFSLFAFKEIHLLLLLLFFINFYFTVKMLCLLPNPMQSPLKPEFL